MKPMKQCCDRPIVAHIALDVLNCKMLTYILCLCLGHHDSIKKWLSNKFDVLNCKTISYILSYASLIQSLSSEVLTPVLHMLHLS